MRNCLTFHYLLLCKCQFILTWKQVRNLWEKSRTNAYSDFFSVCVVFIAHLFCPKMTKRKKLNKTGENCTCEEAVEKEP